MIPKSADSALFRAACQSIKMASLNTNSELAVLLLQLLARGELPATRVAEIAAAAWRDGWGRNDPLATDLARLFETNHKQNMLRRVIAAATRAGFMNQAAKPYETKVRGPGGSEMTQEIFLPSEIYYHETKNAGGNLQPWCLSPAELASDSGLGRTMREWCEDPQVNVTEHQDRVAAFGLHADGATYTTTNRAGGTKSVIVCSMNIISASDKSRRGKRHLLFVISKKKLCDCGCSAFHTLQDCFAVVAWAMGHLAAGQWPARRHDGREWSRVDRKNRVFTEQPLPRAALLMLRGDWEWMCLCFRFRLPSQDLFCWLCNATLSPGPLCYRNFRPDAAHRSTLISHRVYLEACSASGSEVSTIFRSPGTKLHHAAVDSMHGGDSGIFCDAIGSLFWLHITNKNWYANKTVGLADLNAKIGKYYTANRDKRLTQVTPLSEVQIKSATLGYPYLKASAAGARHLADFCVALAFEHLHGAGTRGPFRFRPTHTLAGQADLHNQLVAECFQGLAAYHRSCAALPFRPADCKAALYRFLQSFSDVHHMWRAGIPEDAQSSLPWHARPKAHMMQHLIEDKIDIFGSPMLFWCYGDEDYVGVIKRVCQMTKHPATLETRVGQKAMIMAGCQLWRELKT